MNDSTKIMDESNNTMSPEKIANDGDPFGQNGSEHVFEAGNAPKTEFSDGTSQEVEGTMPLKKTPKSQKRSLKTIRKPSKRANFQLLPKRIINTARACSGERFFDPVRRRLNF